MPSLPRSGPRSGRCALRLALAALLLSVALPAHAQQAVDGTETDSPPSMEDGDSSILLRGTLGSGDQETSLAAGAPGSQDRDTADPLSQLTDAEPVPVPLSRQTQGRAQREQPAAQVTDPLATGTPSTRSNTREPKLQDGFSRVAEQDPFAAIGLRVGSWIAVSTLEQTVGVSSNIDGAAMGEAGAFSRTDATYSLTSDGSRHSAAIRADASFQRNFGGGEETIPTASVEGNLNLDLVDGVAAQLGARYGYATESASSNAITDAASGRTGVHTFSANAGLARTDRRLQFTLRGSAERTLYDDIELEGGGTASQADRNNTLYTATARIGYEVSPAITPFVEGEIGRRLHDEKTDRNGEQRDSAILAARGGVELDFGEKLGGEIAAGYRVEDFADPGLDTLAGLTIDGNLDWSPERGTTVNLNAATDFSGATTAGSSGSMVMTAGAGIERKVNDRLTLTTRGSVAHTTATSSNAAQTLYTASTGFTYWLNRFMALTGTAEYENQQSFDRAQTYDAASIRAGVKFQR
ncbi:MAG: outer membrane beta-barrel protein [Nitratireductor sp.]|nr:outer membrane beta-barrel protein [Nitratireductor sp.]